jgi:hypothetical protein
MHAQSGHWKSIRFDSIARDCAWKNQYWVVTTAAQWTRTFDAKSENRATEMIGTHQEKRLE